ncbi:MAG TPA: PhaM family polyhydroxyalkanoate granule multifunctional regulatory protein [Eoetvoesiella sp.]|uniref:PhaM family polyhydroxyalkanoate granule multifunctional regulatory protein n=1 Tax=Eoetvoesiella sp. TaxID=1966355 RepID=UPI002CCED624|nr:PhaM family polyhydroxyalkanoate granule multifunctional regulatory protein [Eoetvoesiella sp.]HWK61103.1 PhaM family polyhydroxyalkanoate granule multifunctional regulatory protein [Eoetvoesiella sp.]
MTTQNTNPFVLPGFGQAGELGQNPLLASMEMMRQAWQGLSSSGALTGAGIAAAPMSLEDLDRRISEMRAVENWLHMSLSMLTSTIQGLEVQRATIATLKSFAVVPHAEDAAEGPSPLEVVLGLKPSGQAKIKSVHENAGPSSGAAAGASGAEQGQGWWNLLQNQFNTLAAATLQSAEAVQAAAAPLAEQAAAVAKSAGNMGQAAVKSPAAKPARPASARKTAPRKRAAAKPRSS